MNPKIMPGGKGRIPYLLRMAFVHAKAGDRDEAMRIWSQAIAEGYQPRPKTKSELMYQIRVAEAANRKFVATLTLESDNPGVETWSPVRRSS